MKIFILCIGLLLASTDTYASDKTLSLGMGVGALYSGLGINIGVQGESDFRFISAGCVDLGYTTISGWYSSYGVGAGWIWANILSKENNKHGIGFYLGSVYREGSIIDPKTVYGAGISYDYFFKGINNSGWNVGFTPAFGRHNGDTKGYLLLQAGYQF